MDWVKKLHCKVVELPVLTDTPSKPVFLGEGMSKLWSLSAERADTLAVDAARNDID
ncbi:MULTISPECIES: hypothetical protein [Vibrio]|uniref:hypothetical protein n=1 Tax=Vibrio TaxID=662 RepID=UPI0004BB98C6|nr:MULTISPECIES: hypothetical protein [Vibrio]HEQ3588061.1 hypothetical protein [Vibrio harveyi]MBN8106964.1 hypothetical protein [Vibrio vulnificus]MDG2933778.1 hypothetical protein [Vibrio parahaemolyticus]HAV1553801.1 hypothetical protein [Vibrio parahaemolyticus]HEQ3594899.1 hypothetical protein [Vibrio harveyi]